MERKRIITLLAMGTMLLSTMPIKAQSDDWGVWTNIAAEKKLTKKWSVNAEGEYRSQDGVNNTERWSVGIGTDYKLAKWLKADVSYVYIHSRQLKETTKKGNILLAYWQPRHRVNVSLTGSVEWSRFKFSLRERWQYTYRPLQYVPKYDADGTRKDDEAKGDRGENMIRSRLQVEYDIAKCDLTPYVSGEIHHNTHGIDKSRWTVGGEYKITKKHLVEAYYRFQDRADEEDPDEHIIGVGYKFKF